MSDKKFKIELFGYGLLIMALLILALTTGHEKTSFVLAAIAVLVLILATFIKEPMGLTIVAYTDASRQYVVVSAKPKMHQPVKFPRMIKDDQGQYEFCEQSDATHAIYKVVTN